MTANTSGPRTHITENKGYLTYAYPSSTPRGTGMQMRSTDEMEKSFKLSHLFAFKKQLYFTFG